MNFKDEINLRKLSIMQNRARNIPSISQYKRDLETLQKTNELLMEQIAQVVKQRDMLNKRLYQLMGDQN